MHRLPGTARSGVFAYSDELTHWANKVDHVEESISEDDSFLEGHANGAGPVGDLEISALGDRSAILVGGAPSPALPLRKSSGSKARRLLLVTSVALTAAMFGFLAIRPRLAKREAVRHHSANAEAEDLYLKGRYYWNKRSPDDLTKAVDYFTQAVVRDPAYPKAYVGLADSYNLLSEYTATPSAETYPKALAAAKKAVELDDTSAEAHASLAFVSFWYSWDIATADREFKRAVSLNPNYVPAHHWYATCLLALGRVKESMAEIENARELDPMSPSILADRALILFHAGQEGKAATLLKEMELAEPEFVSVHRYLADIYLQSADYQNYISETRTVAVLSRDPETLAVADAGQKALTEAGGKAMFKAMLQVQKDFYAQGKMTAYTLAITCSLLGEKQTALKYLWNAYSKHESSLVALRSDPPFRSLHHEPSYEELLKRIGTPSQT